MPVVLNGEGMYISGRTQMLSHKYSIAESFEFFNKTGFTGIELCYEDLLFNLRPDLNDDKIIDYIVELSKINNLKITAVGNHLQYVFDDFMLDFIKRSLEKTKMYGTDIFILSTMVEITEKVTYPDIWNVFVKRVREIVKKAEDEGVKIAIEPEPKSMITNTKDFMRLAEEINSPNIVCNFDIGHAFLTDDNIFDSIDMIKDKIIHCHIEDVKKGEHIHLVPGRGEIDLKKVIDKLKSIGFDGGMSLDIYHYDYEKIAQESICYLNKII